ncbi:MAG TPA: hypothetical protein VKS98_09935 [Chthoniobacterales bacterium]|nr:hypothetical protein [Chthoniobacterales bacterium]
MRISSSAGSLVAALFLLLLPGAFAESDFSAFWKNFKSAVIANDKARVVQMTKFPMSIYGSEIKTQAEFLRRYGKIFSGEANAAACFAKAEPQKDSETMYSVYCPFKKTPNDLENAPIRFVFESTKAGWKFTALDNINE